MHQRLRLLGLLAWLGGSALVAGQASQAPTVQPPVFRTEVEYVEVDAVVTDLEAYSTAPVGYLASSRDAQERTA